MTADPRPARRRLRAVPEPGSSSAATLPQAGSVNHQDTHNDHDPTGQERDVMNGVGNTTTDKSNECGVHPGPALARWARRVFVEPWNDVVCAVVGLTLDTIMVLICVHYVRNGVISTWLDTHGGHWAWAVAGAFAAVVLGELLDNLARLHHLACGALDRRHMRAIANRLAAAGLDSPSGENTGGERP